MEQKSSTISSTKRYMTVGQVAEYLGLSECTIYRLIHRNAIPFSPIGRSRRFDPIAIDEWMAKRRVSATI